MPSRWAVVAEFILTERGKLDRSLLPEPNLTASSGHRSEPPATPIREYSLMERIEVFRDAQEVRSPAARILRVLARTFEGLSTHFHVKTEVRRAQATRRTEPYSMERMVQVRESHLQAMREYKPEPLDFPITLCRSSVVDDKFEIPSGYGWGIVSPAVEVVDVPGKHLTMFDPPHAASLAAVVGAPM